MASTRIGDLILAISFLVIPLFRPLSLGVATPAILLVPGGFDKVLGLE
jgi:hypothetical protein